MATEPTPVSAGKYFSSNLLRLTRGVIFFALYLLAVFAAPCLADDAPPPQAFVKVNQLYFLYTYPYVPYLTKSGVLMVGLRGIGIALAYDDPNKPTFQNFPNAIGHIDTNITAKSETLICLGHTLTYTANSDAVQVDGKEIPIGAPAHWDPTSNEMAVPALSLAQCLGLKTQWDPTSRTLSIIGAHSLTGSESAAIGVGMRKLIGEDTTSLVPFRVIYHTKNASKDIKFPLGNSNTLRKPWIMVTVRNESRSVINTEGLNDAIIYSDEGESLNLDANPYMSLHEEVGGPDSYTVRPGGTLDYPVLLQNEEDYLSPRKTSTVIPIDFIACPVAGFPDAVSSVSSPGFLLSSEGYIDPSITGHAREVVVAAMANLRPQDRENVIVIAPNGKVYANKPQLVNFYDPLKPIGKNLYKDADGHIVTLPAFEPRPTAAGPPNGNPPGGPPPVYFKLSA